MNLKSLFLGFLNLCFFSLQFGFMEPEHSIITTQAISEGENLVLTFKVTPKEGMNLTSDGPWELSLEKTDGLTLPLVNSKYIQKADQYDKELPGFKVEMKSKPSKQSGEVTYSLRAFVCTVDKTRCFPEIHKGSLGWTSK